MQNHSKVLGNFIEKRRLEMRLMRKDLARMLGFGNLGRGIYKIEQIEDGRMEERLVSRICALLEITELDLKRCRKEEDRLLLEYKLSLPPFKPHISVRLGSCFGKNYAIPGNITGTDGYLCYALGLAKTTGQTMRLWITRDLSYAIEPGGKYKVVRQ